MIAAFSVDRWTFQRCTNNKKKHNCSKNFREINLLILLILYSKESVDSVDLFNSVDFLIQKKPKAHLEVPSISARAAAPIAFAAWSSVCFTCYHHDTVPETNITRENRPGPKWKFHLPIIPFSGPNLLLVSGRVNYLPTVNQILGGLQLVHIF